MFTPAPPNPHGLTLRECFTAGHTVYLSCGPCRVGRYLDYSLVGKWADRKVLDLAREGRFTCVDCGAPSSFLQISAHLQVEPVLTWRVGDDALPLG